MNQIFELFEFSLFRCVADARRRSSDIDQCGGCARLDNSFGNHVTTADFDFCGNWNFCYFVIGVCSNATTKYIRWRIDRFLYFFFLTLLIFFIKTKQNKLISFGKEYCTSRFQSKTITISDLDFLKKWFSGWNCIMWTESKRKSIIQIISN